MSNDTLPEPSSLRASFAIHSEASESNLLRLENKYLKELVSLLSKILFRVVFKNAMDAK
jgi:hypothetical protein